MAENQDDFNFDALDAIFDSDLDGLLDAPEKPKPVTSLDRLQRAFSEVVEFYREHDREPSSTTRDIAERKLGARLDGIRLDEEKKSKLLELDEFGLLADAEAPESLDDVLDSDDFDLLGDDSGVLDLSSLPVSESETREFEAARRDKCADFEQFEPLFRQQHAKLATGELALAKFKGLNTVKEGRYFVLGGLMLYVAEVGETQTVNLGNRDRTKERLRVIFENGTESAMYRQSLSIRLHEQSGQALVRTSIDAEDIFEEDKETGHIYVLSSESEDPAVKGIPNLYKIGFSRDEVKKRIANAEKDPTYLMAPVKVMDDYKIYNAQPSKVEALIHKLFAPARLNLSQVDAAGKNYDPSEWFMVPLDEIQKGIELIVSGDVIHYHYDRQQEKLVPVAE
ncbi:MAG: GIY-YIG nuclease family protein [Corynebacterium glutamicum]|nr:GIY-YIG nuclease family protein [Corynebacterium glutamicum]